MNASRPWRWMPAAARPALAALLILPALAAPIEANVIEQTLEFPGLAVSRDESGSWSVLSLPGARVDVAFGEPQVPSAELFVPIPPEAQVSGVSLQPLVQEWVALVLPVEPYAGEEAVDVVPTSPPSHPPVLYAADAHFPAEWVELVSTVTLSRGERYAVLRVHPLRLWPAALKLLHVSSARLTLTLAEADGGDEGLARRRAPLQAPVAAAPGASGRLLWVEPGFAPAPIPSVEGSPVEYAIISPPDAAMVAAWQVLADWKTSIGRPAQVFTTEWIESQYPSGADLAERIRLFLQDAYTHWGLKWVLMGGDADQVPVRYGRSMAYGTGGTMIATDYYYACLEGNWDADGDGVFGESGNVGPDWADTTPEIHVGRISARTAAEVNDYLEKYFTYTRTPPSDGYLDRYLIMGEVLFHAQWGLQARGGLPDCHNEECQADYCREIEGRVVCVTMDGADDCFRIESLLADTLGLPLQRTLLLERAAYWNQQKPEMDPDAILESTSEVLAQINAGHGFVQQIGHGDRDRWAIGSGRLQAADLASFTNGNADHFFWAYASNCYSAAVDYDCIGERMVLLPDQGAVGYMGCTSADFPGTAWKFIEDFYRFGFEADGRTIGDGFYGAQGAHALTGEFANSEFGYTRFLLYSQLLIGEPGMEIWRGTPEAISVAIVGHPGWTVPLGTTPLTVAVTRGGAALEGAWVCIHKEGEHYALGETGADGRVTLTFHPQSTGVFSVGVTAPGCRPVLVDDAEVTSAAPGAVVQAAGFTVRDDGSQGSDGNANAAIEAGEEIVLDLDLANLGSAAASSVSAKLRLPGDLPAGTVTLVDSTETIASVPVGTTSVSAFRLAFSARPPEATFGEADARRIPVKVLLTIGGATTETDLAIELTRPRIALSPNLFEDKPGSSADLWLGLENRGRGAGSRLTAKLTSLNPADIAVNGSSSATLSIEDIAPGDTALAGPFHLLVYNELARLRLEVISTYDEIDTLHARELDLSRPAAPGQVTLIGLPRAMQVSWAAPADPGGDTIAGYKVYRAAGGSGNLVEVFDGIMEGHRFFQDDGLAELAQYSYTVVAVDEGGNAGFSSSAITAYTSPGQSPGWPNQLGVDTEASPLICELDGWASTGWGREIIFGGETIYAFHSDGTEVIDGDNLEHTRGPFTAPGLNGQVADEFWGRAACGDVDGDGEMEIVSAAFNRTNDSNLPNARGEVLCYGPWGKWPEWIFTMPKCVAWTTPTLYDLDEDGTLETIFLAGPTGHAGIYVLDHQGHPWGNADPATGLLRDLGGKNLYQRPAVGDVDGNGEPDIVVATRTDNVANGAIHVVRADGNYVVGFSGSGQGLKFADIAGGLANQSTTGSVTLSNVDGTPGDEIFIVTPDRLWCIKRNGILLWKLDFTSKFTDQYQVFPEPAIGDVNRDNLVDIVLVDASAKLHVLRGATGLPVSPFPIQLPAGIFYSSCILANVDESPQPEILFGDNQQRIHAYTYTGEIARGFPIYFGGNFVQQSLAAWDIDADGFQNLVVQADQTQKLSVFDLTSSPFPSDPAEQAKQNPWPMRNRDAGNTGRYSAEPPVAVGVTAEAAVVSEDGSVLLAWSAAEEALAFRLRRASGPDVEPELIAEIDAEAGTGTHRYTYTDSPPGAGTYLYHINPVTLAGEEEEGPLVWARVTGGSAVRFGFRQVTPDPLAAGRPATIAFGLPGTAGEARDVRLEVFDILGRRMATLAEGERPAGSHAVVWDGRGEGGRPVAAGLYLLRLEAGGESASRRLLVVR